MRHSPEGVEPVVACLHLYAPLNGVGVGRQQQLHSGGGKLAVRRQRADCHRGVQRWRALH